MLAAAQVINAIATRITGLASTGARVYTSRAWPLAEKDLPAWRVVAGSEAVDSAELATRMGEHTLEVVASAYVRAAADLDDALHALAEAALPALFADPVPYALQLVGIERQLAMEGEAAVGVISLRLRALFFARPTAPDTILSS